LGAFTFLRAGRCAYFDWILQSITVQCLEALQFLHGLGLIHCDLKPENILVKSYSRCEVKVIDLGSSCFETDHLCSYVQSRSYRAPEVILGLPYDKKIDVWSLGCILAELCTGNVSVVHQYIYACLRMNYVCIFFISFTSFFS
jgi:serine/threonine protein kinase